MKPTAKEFAQLKKEVAALRAEIAELRQFFSVTRSRKSKSRSSLILRCAGIELVSPEDSSQCQGGLFATKGGPHLTLWGSDSKARVIVSAEDDEASCRLLGKNLKDAVYFRADRSSGRGEMAVFDAGKPRAVVKATPDGGAVSVVDDNGVPQAFMHGSAKGGEMRILTRDLKTAARISGDGPNGGFFAVNQADGRPAVVLTSTGVGGTVMAMGQDKKLTCALGATKLGGSLAILDKNEKHSISLISTAEGGVVRVADANGRTAAELCPEEHGGVLILNDKQGRERAAIRQTDTDSYLKLNAADGRTNVVLSATDEQSSLLLRNAAGGAATLHSSATSSALAVTDQEGKPRLYAGSSPDSVSIHLRPNDEMTSAVSVFTQEEGGGILVSGTDGVRRGGFFASNSGGQLSLYNDLGIERVLLGSADDGGALRLSWGGTMGVAALAQQRGGTILVNDSEGKPVASLPPLAADDEGDETDETGGR